MAKKDARRGKRRVRLTPVSTYHYFRLVYRSVLLLAVLIFYIRYRLNMGGSGAEITKLLEGRPVVLGPGWKAREVRSSLPETISARVRQTYRFRTITEPCWSL